MSSLRIDKITKQIAQRCTKYNLSKKMYFHVQSKKQIIGIIVTPAISAKPSLLLYYLFRDVNDRKRDDSQHY
jgi:hypothetical protein